MYSLLLSLRHFDSYLRGRSSKSLKKYMKFYNDKPAILARDFHRLKTNANDEIKECIRTILINLNIPKEEWKKFSEITIYEFLLQLARDGHPQVNYIIEMLDQKTRIGVLEYVLGGSILLSFAIYLLTLPALQFIISAAVTFFSSILSFPIIGLVFNIGYFAYFFYHYYYDLKKTDFNRTRDLLFLTLSTATLLAGYIILIAASASMSPVIAGLYVASAGIDFLKEVFCLGQEFYHYVNRPPINENDYLRSNREYLREVYGFEKRRNALAISFIAGLLVVAITALWCFLPGGMVATVFALSAIGIVYLIKMLLVKRNETLLREHLQEQLEILEISYENSLLNENTAENKLQVEIAIPCTPNRHPFLSSIKNKDLLINADTDSDSLEDSPQPKQPIPSTPSRHPFFASLENKNLLSENKAQFPTMSAEKNNRLEDGPKTPRYTHSRQNPHLPRTRSTPITPSHFPISNKDIRTDLPAKSMTVENGLKSPRYSQSANNSRKTLSQREKFILNTPYRPPFFASLEDKDLLSENEQTFSDATHKVNNRSMQKPKTLRRKSFQITNQPQFLKEVNLQKNDKEQEHKEDNQELDQKVNFLG